MNSSWNPRRVWAKGGAREPGGWIRYISYGSSAGVELGQHRVEELACQSLVPVGAMSTADRGGGRRVMTAWGGGFNANR